MNGSRREEGEVVTKSSLKRREWKLQTRQDKTRKSAAFGDVGYDALVQLFILRKVYLGIWFKGLLSLNSIRFLSDADHNFWGRAVFPSDFISKIPTKISNFKMNGEGQPAPTNFASSLQLLCSTAREVKIHSNESFQYLVSEWETTSAPRQKLKIWDWNRAEGVTSCGCCNLLLRAIPSSSGECCVLWVSNRIWYECEIHRFFRVF